MDQFMREKKIIKWNNIITQSHHRIYTDESLEHDDTSQRRSVKFCTCHCWSHTSCLLSCSLLYSINGLLANTGDLVTVGSQNFRQDTEGGGTLEGKRSGWWEKVNKKRRNAESTYMDGMWPRFLLNFCMFDCEWHCMTSCTFIILILN